MLVVLASYPNNSRLRSEIEDTLGSITIGAVAWIGACAVLLPNVTIGEGAIVATSAVVRANVLPHTLVGGIPAHHIRDLTGSPTS